MDEHGLSIKDAWLAFSGVGIIINYGVFEKFVDEHELYVTHRLGKYIPESKLPELIRGLGFSIDPSFLVNTHLDSEETLDRQVS